MGDVTIATTNSPLLRRRTREFSRCVSHMQDELKSFRIWLKWMCVDQSNLFTACLSWFIFTIFAIVVPAFSHFFLACSSCDSKHERPYDGVIQLSLSSVAILSFLCISAFVRKYGLRRFLFFDKLYEESETVRGGYTEQLHIYDAIAFLSSNELTSLNFSVQRSLMLILLFVIPCFLAECAYKIWWYCSGASQIPFLGNVYVSDAVACLLELCSWLYRITVFFLVCVLFRLICYLQILRLQDFAQVFMVESDVGSVLGEHLRIRRHLRIISHRYRGFILFALIFITASQFASLLVTTKSSAYHNIFSAGELALCSIALVAGLLILLRSATKITHKAQALTALASKWHVCATIDSFDINETETPTAGISNAQSFSATLNGESEGDYSGDEDDELDNAKIVPQYALSTVSFQKRQALVTYFENNRAGITVFGFVLDRTSNHTIFGIELSLVLWLLGKTIGIS
ncbi:Protein of unknown function DUF3537 [Dillenia turbinata]|uniref:Uncharacterized protein n=1 Tax=Dillenia turbinata TaxID=194707 RepID=A0AAN8ZHH5_9MAGN